MGIRPVTTGAPCAEELSSKLNSRRRRLRGRDRIGISLLKSDSLQCAAGRKQAGDLSPREVRYVTYGFERKQLNPPPDACD